MPHRWTPAPDHETLTLWPHRALGRKGFAWFIGLTAAGLSLPVASQLGHGTLWVILAFGAATVGGLWLAIQRNWADRAITETLTLAPERLELVRQARRRQAFQANPHWVRLRLYPSEGPVPDYLTLSAGGREVELGAFLTPEERRALHDDLARRLAALR